MNALATHLAFWSIAGAFAIGQSTPPLNGRIERQRLKIIETEELQKYGTESEMPWLCDDEGNIYGRIWNGNGSSQPKEADDIYKFNTKGALISTYSASGFRPVDSHRFAIGKGGDVFRLVQTKDGQRVIAAYAADGTIKEKLKLPPEIDLLLFQPFDSGEFLTTGLRRGSESDRYHTILTTILAKDGTWLKSVELPEDKPFDDAADRGDPSFVTPGQDKVGNLAVERGPLARGADGNVYVARWTVPTRIYAIAPSGEVVRSFEVSPPAKGLKPNKVVAHENSLAIQYDWESLDRSVRSVIKVVDLDGRDQAVYGLSRQDYGGLVCYTGAGRFTLLSGNRILFAEPR